MIELSKYLTRKHLEYCNQINDVVSEADWVKHGVNKNLPPDDKISYPSLNRWINGEKTPDARNIIRLIKAFGPEVMPYVGIELPDDLAVVLNNWHYLPEYVRKNISEMAKDAGSKNINHG